MSPPSPLSQLLIIEFVDAEEGTEGGGINRPERSTLRICVTSGNLSSGQWHHTGNNLWYQDFPMAAASTSTSTSASSPSCHTPPWRHGFTMELLVLLAKMGGTDFPWILGPWYVDERREERRRPEKKTREARRSEEKRRKAKRRYIMVVE